MIETIFTDIDQLTDFLNKQLNTIEGVLRVETAVYQEILKFKIVPDLRLYHDSNSESG